MGGRNLLYKMALISAALAMSTWVALADTVHQIRFANPARVLVWQDGAPAGQGANVEVLPARAPFSMTPFGSGTLIRVASMPSPQDGRTTLRIASNCGFVIQTSDSDSAAQVRTRFLKRGPNAQFQPSERPSDATVVFLQTEKTAIRRGTPESQSIELEVTWQGAIPPTLHVLAIDN